MDKKFVMSHQVGIHQMSSNIRPGKYDDMSRGNSASVESTEKNHDFTEATGATAAKYGPCILMPSTICTDYNQIMIGMFRIVCVHYFAALLRAFANLLHPCPDCV